MNDELDESEPRSGFDDVSRVSVAGLNVEFNKILNKMSALEIMIKKNNSVHDTRSYYLEVIKVILGGWPFISILLALFLFYAPIKSFFDEMPNKLKGANEVSVMGVSLKNTLKNEAEKAGENKLYDTIPNLSYQAIKFLFKAPDGAQSLISNISSSSNQIKTFNFPSEEMLTALSELQSKDLITIYYSWESRGEQVSGEAASKKIDEFKLSHPGHLVSKEPNRYQWELETPIPQKTGYPVISWKLSDLGKKAITIITDSVYVELSRN